MKYNKDGKPGSQLDKSSRIVPMTILLVVFCGFSFYLGGIFCSDKDKIVANEVAKAVHSIEDSTAGPIQAKHVSFSECSSDYQDYTPCTDPRVISYLHISLCYMHLFIMGQGYSM